MIRKLRAPLADIFAHWRIGLMVAVVVAGLLTLGLSMRPRYIADASVDIGGILSIAERPINMGGILSEDPVGLVRFLPFEGAKEVEHFFSHEVFAKVSNGFDGRCSAAAVYSPNGLRLKMTCRGGSESQVRELTLSALRPLLERHARHYEIAKTIDEQRQKLIERQIRGVEQMIAALRKPPVSSLSEALIIERQMKIENLHNQIAIERMLGNRASQTQIDTQGVSVVDRKPGFGVWAAVAFLALFAGLFVVVFAATLKHLEQEAPRRNA